MFTTMNALHPSCASKHETAPAAREVED